MFFLFFQLCTIIALIPLVLSLNITLESAPEAFQSTPISLRRDRDDPIEFVLGAFTLNGNVAATTNQVVANFTADRIVNMTFNYTSPSGKDCILLAWIPQAGPRNNYAQSELFSVISETTTATPSESVKMRLSFPSTSLTSSTGLTSSPTTANSTSSGSGPTSTPGTGQKAIPTEAVVGAVIGSFVLLSIVSVALFIMLWRRRNRKLKESAPSRAFWRYLDRKGPPISRRPVREPLPAYTAQGRTFQRPAVRPPPLRLPD